MKRVVLAAAAGYMLWSVLWIGFGQAMIAALPSHFGEHGASTHPGVLTAFLAFSVGISLAGGALAARIAKAAPLRAGRILAGALLATGLLVELGGWGLAPAWYHIVFLALLVPATCGGTRLASRRR